MRHLLVISTLVLGLGQPVVAQSLPGAEQATTLSGGRPAARAVPAHRVMFQKTIWRMMDLREKPNRPFYARGHEVTALLVAAVKRGELPAYETDSLTRPLDVATFRQRLVAEEVIPTTFNEAGDAVAEGPAVQHEYLPRQLYQLELVEDWVFDQRHSRMVHQPRVLTLVIPAAETAKGVDWPVASFRYADALRVFRAHPETAIWYNVANQGRHLNLADAFELGLYRSYIRKISNPYDRDLFDQAGSGPGGIAASHQAEQDLIEFESNLWSY